MILGFFLSVEKERALQRRLIVNNVNLNISRDTKYPVLSVLLSGGSGIHRVTAGIAAQSQAPPLPGRAQARSAFVVIPC